MTIENGPNRQRLAAARIMHRSTKPRGQHYAAPIPWRQGDCVAVASRATERPELPGRELVDAHELSGNQRVRTEYREPADAARPA